MIFLKKCMEIWYFLQMPQKHGLSKKTSRWNVTFLYIWKDCIFFLGKHDFFFDGKWKMIFLKKYMEIWYFLYICINVTNMILPFFKKNHRWPSPKRTHLNVMDVLDHILERVPKILCTFIETFVGVLIYYFPVKTPQET